MIFVLGLVIMSVTVCLSLISCRVQSLFKKSLFNLSGAAQAIAGKTIFELTKTLIMS